MTGRSAIQKLLSQLQSSLDQNSFVSLRLSHATCGGNANSKVRNPTCSADAQRSPKPESKIDRAIRSEALIDAMDVRLIELKGEPHLSLVTHEPKRDVTENLPLAEGVEWISQRIGVKFRNALLKTTRRDWQLHCPEKGEPRLVGHKPATPALPSREHDAPKHTLLGTNAADWLHALGITHSNGRPRVSMADKHRQISRYVELLSHLARDCGWTGRDNSAPMLKVADMGCGKGYLTFGAWHLFARVLHRPVSVLGVESRAELVNGANGAAQQINAAGLEFVSGTIATAQLPRLDVLVALHARDTATDDAIRRGIELGAKLIVVAPCCHQSLRPELDSPEPFTAILRHGLFKERMAEWLTDGLRTLFLEWAGYQTKVIEFVGSEHTPKNLMIAAVLKHPPYKDAALMQRILELKRFFGIKHHALDELSQ